MIKNNLNKNEISNLEIKTKEIIEEINVEEINVEEILKNKARSLIIKRIFDILISGIGILFISPIFLIISLLVKITSEGPIFFKQIRIGKNGREFKILKFRTMIVEAEKVGMQITVGKDSRITKIGHFLRKTKLDELPQLINVIIGDMSLVGPRPEVPKYVNLYSENQKKILLVRPGITDIASIEFRNENDILGLSSNPEKEYIENIMSKKIELNYYYLKNISCIEDLKIIFKTILAILN